MIFCWITAELMVLGFISLLLTFSQYYISKICISQSVADTMLPCSVGEKKGHVKGGEGEEENRRRLLWYDHRSLSVSNNKSTCKEVQVFMICITCTTSVVQYACSLLIAHSHTCTFFFPSILKLKGRRVGFSCLNLSNLRTRDCTHTQIFT